MADKGVRVIVIGHKNPDTDSICSAIAYAELKASLSDGDYIPMRAGPMNDETLYVLKRFGVEEPAYIQNVKTQVKDVEFRKTEGVSSAISLKEAWTFMKRENVVTLPVTSEGELQGLITISDIAKSYMIEQDNTILSKAETRFKNIVDTLDGNMIVGNQQDCFSNGKVLVAAANPDMMENFIVPGDLIILENRYESQLCAIEMNAGCIIVCGGFTVSHTIQMLAMKRGCKIITTAYDTYSVARLINQSIPISYFMKKENLVMFHMEDFIDDIQKIMVNKRYRDFPVNEDSGKYVGMISRRNLLACYRKKLILVDHNEKSQAVDGIKEAEILEIIDHHRLSTIETIAPVYFRNQPLGCTSTIIYKMYRESHVPVRKVTAGLLCSAIISDTLLYRSPTCTPEDRLCAKELAAIAGIDEMEHAKEMFSASSNLSQKSEREIFYQDFKKFSFNEITLGVGQINSMNKEELDMIKKRILPFLPMEARSQRLDMVFFLFTDIIEESSELIYCGIKAKELIENAFHVTCSDQSVFLKGVVSRKKQIIPALMETLQQEN